MRRTGTSRPLQGNISSDDLVPWRSNTLATGRGLWGQALVDEMQRYNHTVGLKIVGEYLPQERNRVTLTDEYDQYGLPIPRVTYSWCDNDKEAD
jgi:hypothetical protein